MNRSQPVKVDGHLHYLSFLQESQGFSALIKHMDAANIGKAVIFGLPVRKMWSEWDERQPQHLWEDDSPAYFYSYTDQIILDEISTLEGEDRQRFAPLLCGFNPVDKFAINHVERVFHKHPHTWKGIGEVLFRHNHITHLIGGDPARADHPAMFPIYEFAAAHKLPVLIHQDITSIEITSEPLYVHELETALQNFPNTTFVWAHCGTSRKVHIEHQYLEVERLLLTYPNLYCDISWSAMSTLIFPHYTLSVRWLQLLEDHHERFCLGSDLTGEFEALGTTMHEFTPLLDKLTPAAQKSLCHEVAEHLYFS